jgi:hypothetical protein
MTFDIVYVHGIGVRGNAYNTEFRLIREKLSACDFFKENGKEIKFHRCAWGDEYGSSMLNGGQSVPEERKRNSDTSKDDKKLKQGLWTLLYREPLFEINVLTMRDQEREGWRGARPQFGSDPSGERLRKKVKAIAFSENLKTLFEQEGITEALFQQGKSLILESQDFSDAMKILNSSSTIPYDYVTALSRGILAQIGLLLISESGQESSFSLTSEKSDLLAQEIADKIADQEKGAISAGKKFLTKIAMNFLRSRRFKASTDYSERLGDILKYQARGQDIRDYIYSIITECQGSVIVIAHSLGGIACVDLFLEKQLPDNVKLLVTVGSQAPALYELGALVNQKYISDAGKLPDSFPKWLNIYDRDDFLSYVGSKIFPGRIVDVEVSTEKLFPASHNDYWKQPGTWNAINNTLKLLSK